VEIASSLSVCLTGSTRKKDTVDRIIGMAHIGAVRDSSGEENGENVIAILYLTAEEVVSQELTTIFKCYTVEQEVERSASWINIVIYLVYRQL